MKTRKLLWLALPMIALVSCSAPSQGSNPQESTVEAEIATTPFVIAEMETTIDATGSAGPGELSDLTFTYDLDGDGTFETEAVDNGYPGYHSHVFEEPGDVEVSVKVEDKKGNSDTASTSFTVYPPDYLNVDKKSELDANITVEGKTATIEVTAPEVAPANTKLRVYLNGTTSETAGAFDDIQTYPVGETPAGETETYTVQLDDLEPGSYQGMIVSTTGPETQVTFNIR